MSRQFHIGIGTVLLCLIGMTPMKAQQMSQLQTELVSHQDFEQIPVGQKLPSSIVDDSSWAGGQTDMRIISSGDPRHGQMLQVGVNGFSQVILERLSLQKNHAYQISMAVSSLRPQALTVLVRKQKAPYTPYAQILFDTLEDMKEYRFIFIAGKDDPAALLMFKLSGSTTLNIDDIRVEKVLGPLPPGIPPTPGNRVMNSGFELGMEGWTGIGELDIKQKLPAFEGQFAMSLSNNCQLTSHWMKLSRQTDYLIRARVKVQSGSARIHMGMNNYIHPQGAYGGIKQIFELQAHDDWQTISLTWRPPAPQQQYIPYANYYFDLRTSYAQTPILIDAIEVRAISSKHENTLSYEPRAATEMAITTDMPMNVATLGQVIKLSVRATGHPGVTILTRSDETGVVRQTYPLVFTNGIADLSLTDLPAGYWRFDTAVKSTVEQRNSRIEGQTFLAVVPSMPDLPGEQWFVGNHIAGDKSMRQAAWKLGFRWDRLHDTSFLTRWDRIAKDGQWHIDHQRTQQHLQPKGMKLLGLLDVHKATRLTPDGGRKWWKNSELFEQFGEYIQQAVGSWEGQIDHWEVLNEPSFVMSVDEYLPILKLTYQQAKKVNPNAFVIGLGGSLPTSRWTMQAIENGASRFCDAISIHAYGSCTWNTVEGPQKLKQIIGSLQNKLAEAGTPNLPIWNTECGIRVRSNWTKFDVPGGQAAPLDAACMFPKSVASTKASGINRTFYYTADVMHRPGDANQLRFLAGFYGTVRMNAVPLAVVISMLEGRQYRSVPIAEIAPKDGLVRLKFVGRGQTVYMLWSTSKPMTLTIPEQMKSIVNMWGRPIAYHPTLQITEQPVYLIMD